MTRKNLLHERVIHGYYHSPDLPELVRDFYIEVEKAAKGEISREQIVRRAEELTGIRILDVGTFELHQYEAKNCSDLLGSMLRSLIEWKHNDVDIARYARAGLTSIPEDTKYIIAGHGIGIGDNWSLLGGHGKVQDYVNKHVPADQKAFVIACRTDTAACAHYLEGHVVASKGVEAVITPAATEASNTSHIAQTEQAISNNIKNMHPAVKAAFIGGSVALVGAIGYWLYHTTRYPASRNAAAQDLNR